MPRKKGLVILAIAAFFIMAVPAVVGAQSQANQQSIYVGADEILAGNFVKVGNVIDIAGAVKGDVIVAANSVTISGSVAGDVIVAANTVNITGDVSGSVRIVANTVNINSYIRNNAWIMASTIVFGDKAKVGWDIYGAAATLEVRGPVTGNIWATGANIILANQTSKNVYLSVDKEGQILLYPTAKINGDLTYKAASDKQLMLQPGAKILGKTTKTELAVTTAATKEAKGFFGLGLVLFKTFGFFGLLVVGLLLIALIPKWLIKVSETMQQQPSVSVGWGVVFFFLAPVAFVFLLITLIGIPLALIILPVYFISLFIAKVVLSLVVGIWLFARLSSNKYKSSLIWPLAVGLLVVMVVTSIPIFGWLIGLVAVWWALGGIIQVQKSIAKEWH